MTQNIFTTEFYKKMYESLMNDIENNSWYTDQYDKIVEGKPIAMDFEGDVYVSCLVMFDYDKHYTSPVDNPNDESWYPEIGGIIGLDDVMVTKENLKDSPVIDGFDVEAFFEANK